jgi:glutamate racemase
MLDSGIGGLSVLREVRRLLPGEPILYVADEGHLPYGPRPRGEIRTFVCDIIQFLLEQHCKLIVIACNTANAAALHDARERFPDVPIVGMEPAIKPAAEHTQTGVIGVIMTKATYQSELFASVVDRFAQGIRVEALACPELVTLAEQGAPDTPEAHTIIAQYMEPLKAAGIDQLVLGCTHFPFLIPQLQAQLGPAVAIIDPAPAVARQVGRVLEQRHLSNAPDGNAPIRYVTSGDPDHLRRLLKQLLGEQQRADIGAARWADHRLVMVEEQRG